MSLSIFASALRAGLLGALLCAAPHLHAACPKSCVTANSVVHAAGVPPELALAAQQVEFDGDKLSAGSKKAVADLAKQVKQLPGSAIAELKIAADSGLTGAAAKAQVQARRTALSAALGQNGLAAAKFQFSAD